MRSIYCRGLFDFCHIDADQNKWQSITNLLRVMDEKIFFESRTKESRIDNRMKIFTLLMSLLFMVSCSSEQPIVQFDDNQAGLWKIENDQNQLTDENYIEAGKGFDVKELGENFNGTVVSRHRNGKISDISTYENSNVVFREEFDEAGQLQRKYESREGGYILSLYENNLISSSQSVNKDASIKTIYQNGIISSEFIIKDALHIQKKYDKDGKLDFVLSSREGDNKIFYQQFDKEENLSFAYHYYNANGEQIYDGTYTEYFPNGNIKIIQEFVENEMTGNITIFNENGGILLKCSNYENSNNGLCNTYHHNGQMESKYEFENNNVLMHNGRSTSWYENGNFRKVGIIRNDKLIGKHINYYENGNIKEEIIYNNDGIIDGVYKLYYENGELKYIINYINGNKEGLFRQYFENGSISYEMYYKNDKLHGKYVQYYPGGGVRQEGFYRDDMKDGVFITRNYQGRITDTTVYNNGVPIK